MNKKTTLYLAFMLMLNLFSASAIAADACETDKDCGGHLKCVSNRCKYVPLANEPKIEKIVKFFKMVDTLSASGEQGLQILVPVSIRSMGQDSVLYLDVWDMNAVRNHNNIKLPDPTGKQGKLRWGYNLKTGQSDLSEMYEHLNTVTTAEIKFTSYNENGDVEGEILILRDSQKSKITFRLADYKSFSEDVPVKNQITTSPTIYISKVIFNQADSKSSPSFVQTQLFR